MAYRVTEFFIPSPGKSRFPSIQVRDIPYKYNATSGIIDADAERIRIQYDESEDEVKLKIRYEVVQRRKYRTFRSELPNKCNTKREFTRKGQSLENIWN